MLDKIFSQIEKLLKPHKIEAFELYAEEKETKSYGAKNGQIDTSEEALERGLALRLFRDHRVSFVYTTQLEAQGLNKLCEAAVSLLPLMDPDEAFRLPPTDPPAAFVDLQDFDESLKQIPVAQKIAQALELERAARDEHSSIRQVRSAGYEEEIVRFELRNSLGFSGKHQRTRCSIAVMAVAESKSESESGYDFASACHFKDLAPSAVGQGAARHAYQALGGQVPLTQRAPVILAPMVSLEFLEVIAPAFSGEAVSKNRSWLADLLGEKIFSTQLQIQDDRLLLKGAHSSPFDGEGQAGRCLTLVESGVLKNYLLNAYAAFKLVLPPNGSSVRKELSRPPVPGPSNLKILPGILSDETIWQQAQKGFWITDVIGMHATDLITGDFSVGAQGFEIVGGQLGRPVKKMALAGNLKTLLQDLKWVGKQSRTQGSLSAPTLGFSEVAVSGR